MVCRIYQNLNRHGTTTLCLLWCTTTTCTILKIYGVVFLVSNVRHSKASKQASYISISIIEYNNDLLTNTNNNNKNNNLAIVLLLQMCICLSLTINQSIQEKIRRV